MPSSVAVPPAHNGNFMYLALGLQKRSRGMEKMLQFMSLFVGELSVLGAGSVFSSLHLLRPHERVWQFGCCAVCLAPNCSPGPDLLWAALAHEPFSSLLSGITHMFWICSVTISDQGYPSSLQYPISSL